MHDEQLTTITKTWTSLSSVFSWRRRRRRRRKSSSFIYGQGLRFHFMIIWGPVRGRYQFKDLQYVSQLYLQIGSWYICHIYDRYQSENWIEKCRIVLMMSRVINLERPNDFLDICIVGNYRQWWWPQTIILAGFVSQDTLSPSLLLKLWLTSNLYKT